MVLKRKNPILMLLKTPPPYGGGEIRGAALRDYVKDNTDFIVQEICSNRRDKTSQGVFAFWKINEFIINWLRFVNLIRQHSPSLIFYPMSKEFIHFLRDSIFFWTAHFFDIPFAVCRRACGGRILFYGTW
jgi:hypothetical protein